MGGVDGLDGAEWVTVSPDGSRFYAAGTGDNAVAVFSVAGVAIFAPSVSECGLIGLTILMSAACVWRFRWRPAPTRRRGLKLTNSR